MKFSFLVCFFLGIISNAISQALVLATYQYADNDRIANIQPLADHLSRGLGLSVETKSYPTVHRLIQAIQDHEVDIALINTFGYLLLDASSKSYAMQPYSVLKVEDGAQDNYRTAVIARRDLAIDTISDINRVAGHSKLGLVAIGSTSGNLVPRLILNASGIKDPETKFASVAYIGNHKTTTDALLQGGVDIAAVGSTEYFNAMADPRKKENIKLLWMSPEIPLGPILMHDRIGSDMRSGIIDLLLHLHTDHPAALESLKAAWSEAKQAEKFIPMDATYYDAFKRQLGSKENMGEILRQFAN
ncbi:MAG TPA: PhnD/SsuA/transferrin family substrate-binding protein [Phnomibacter sp.]|nr:PhnD/SsuA/transferrin family substrate-binding protein [Phnomibacter sp.]